MSLTSLNRKVVSTCMNIIIRYSFAYRWFFHSDFSQSDIAKGLGFWLLYNCWQAFNHLILEYARKFCCNCSQVLLLHTRCSCWWRHLISTLIVIPVFHKSPLNSLLRLRLSCISSPFSPTIYFLQHYYICVEFYCYTVYIKNVQNGIRNIRTL